MGTSSGASSFTSSSFFSLGTAQDFRFPSKSSKQGQANASSAEGEKNNKDAETNLKDELVDLLGTNVMTQTAKWPTCNWKEDGVCNTRDLRGFIREGSIIRYKDYGWYNTIEDSELKEEAMINKRILEESREQGWFDEHGLMEDDDDDMKDLEDYLIQKDHPYYVNEEEERSKEKRCKLLRIPYMKPPTCKTEKFKIVDMTYPTSMDMAY
nr:hypothetical protein [Tanacetum cinerariifolium]